MSEKKMVSRNVASRLGIICILLIAGLGGTMAYYISSHSHTNADYDAMRTPQLMGVGLGVTRNFVPELVYLNVHGYLVNIHMNSAFNCKLHVVAYLTDQVVPFDTYIDLGTIVGESSIKVDSNFNASGNLTTYTLTPQWAATP